MTLNNRVWFQSFLIINLYLNKFHTYGKYETSKISNLKNVCACYGFNFFLNEIYQRAYFSVVKKVKDF